MCAVPLSFRFSLDFACFPSILVLSRRDELRKENTYEKINHHHSRTYYDALHSTESGHRTTAVTAPETPQTVIVTQVEQVPEESETTAETAFVSEVKETETVKKAASEEEPTIQEEVTEEFTEITEETVVTEPEEETVECIDEGDQSLAEYKPQIGGQPNPFENDTPTEIDDRPIEDYIGEGEDRPGEGIHF